MTTLFLLIQKEKHIDNSYKLFDNFKQAEQIAQEITAYWIEQYALNNLHIDRQLYGNNLYSAIENGQSLFSINILPIDKIPNP